MTSHHQAQTEIQILASFYVFEEAKDIRSNKYGISTNPNPAPIGAGFGFAAFGGGGGVELSEPFSPLFFSDSI